ncbi:MAG: tryptophan-rich sensory protein [Clostridia bacterium]|nr:tryptophan-rich sensory protein [Clostridia bacterium]
MKPINLKKLAIAIAIPEAVGLLASLVSGNIGSRYSEFQKPPLSPPGWIFPVVWVILYALMGIASYLVAQSGYGSKDDKSNAFIFYGTQLFFNFLWPIIFFRFEAYILAVAVIFVLNILVIITALCFGRFDRRAFYLFIPYIIWLLFATYLNIGVALLN